ncbi:MAG: divergent polysaccharide deacetylase family protein [Nitrospirae bacterium]|nr:divergent polysaccharide deacetylase family protein [Nitrospirota bacterium]
MAKSKNKKHHIILILLLLIAGIFFLVREFGKEKIPKVVPRKADKIAPKPIKPKAAVVIDDLGTNKDAANAVLKINAPLTLSILPQQPYTAWIAEEGHRLGRDVIAHIPMEASPPHDLGKGGLYTWMTDKEIAETLDYDIRSVPHLQGVSSHMGSAFTQDERAMNVVISELKKRRLFFLDSITSPRSIGFNLAQKQGLKALSRDVFLDDKDDPAGIEAQWKRFVSIADKKGHAILLAHPRENTLKFLQKVLRGNDDVTVVPISELVSR